MDFGTRLLEVTFFPAQMTSMIMNLESKQQLEVIDILNDDGTLNERLKSFVGEYHFIRRK